MTSELGMACTSPVQNIRISFAILLVKVHAQRFMHLYFGDDGRHFSSHFISHRAAFSALIAPTRDFLWFH